MHSNRQSPRAEAALSAQPNAANIARVESLRNRVALADLMSRGGQGAFFGSLGQEFAQQYGFNRARPNVAAADAERGALSAILGKQNNPTPSRRQSHHSNRQPRVGGRFAGPPED